MLSKSEYGLRANKSAYLPRGFEFAQIGANPPRLSTVSAVAEKALKVIHRAAPRKSVEIIETEITTTRGPIASEA